MAPDAPPPVYNSNGQQVTEWLIVVAYRPEQDALTLSWTRDGDLFRRAQQGAIAFPPDQVADLVESVTTRIYALSQPRLW